MRPLAPSIVKNAITQLGRGMSCREVANALKISITSVERIRKREETNIPPIKYGGPSKISKEGRRYLTRQYVTGNLETLKDGQQFIQSTEGVHVAAQTVRNHLMSEGLATYVKHKRPNLTEDQKAIRYQFAKDHLCWTLEDWKQVMFSDETIISRVGSYGRKYYFKNPKDKSFRPHHIKKTMQGGGGKLVVWGCMTYYGVGDASWIHGTLDSDTYVNILQDYVFASRDHYGMNKKKFQFQQDNSRVHTSKMTMRYIKNSKIPLMKWPVNSPDLSPIESIWSYIKRELDRYQKIPKDMSELWERVQKI